MALRSDRLKKLEIELDDLVQWMKMGLVPKSDIDRHKEEIERVKSKIKDEEDRLRFLKESGEAEEYIAPKRNASRASFAEMAPMNDIDADHGHGGDNDEGGSFDIDDDESESADSADEEKEHDEEVEEEDNDTFSGRGRYRSGWTRDILDPDSNEW